MFIEINIANYQELEAITILLLNKVIEANEIKLTFADTDIEKIINILQGSLTEKEQLGKIIPAINTKYSKDDILSLARRLLLESKSNNRTGGSK